VPFVGKSCVGLVPSVPHGERLMVLMSEIVIEIPLSALATPAVATAFNELTAALGVPVPLVGHVPQQADDAHLVAVLELTREVHSDDNLQQETPYEVRFLTWIQSMAQGERLVRYFQALEAAGEHGLSIEAGQKFFPDHPGKKFGGLLGGVSRWCEKHVGCPAPFKQKGPKEGILWIGFPTSLD